MTIIDQHAPRFGRVRWTFVRGVLRLTNVFDRWLKGLREWALQEAVETSPNYEVFEAYITKHYAQRGQTAKVSVIEATVTVTPTSNSYANSQYLQ